MNEAITPEHVCLYLIVRRQAEVSYFFIFLLKECTRHVMNVRNIPERSIKVTYVTVVMLFKEEYFSPYILHSTDRKQKEWLPYC